MSFSAICAFCELRQLPHTMLSFPEDPATQANWRQCLGDDIFTRIQTLENPMVCRNHVIKQEDDPVIVKVEPQAPADTQPKRKIMAVCRACGQNGPEDTLVCVPVNKERREAFVQILGEGFAQRIALYSHNKICLKHLDRPTRRNLRLPTGFVEYKHVDRRRIVVKQEENNNDGLAGGQANENPQVENGFNALPNMNQPLIYPINPALISLAISMSHAPLHECRICNAIVFECFMVMVPSDPKLLGPKLFPIFGFPFLQNMHFNPPPHFVCSAHMHGVLQFLAQQPW